MKSLRVVVGIFLSFAWAVGEYAVYMVLVEAARVADGIYPTLINGASDAWFEQGAALYLTSAFAVLVVACVLDFFGAPKWHRAIGFGVSMVAFALTVVPGLKVEYGLLELPLRVWAARALAVTWSMAVSLVFASRLRALGARLSVRARVFVALGMCLAFSLYFLPGLYTRGPGLPPGRYEDVLLERVSLRGEAMNAGISLDLESNRDRYNSFETDDETRYMVGDEAATFQQFKDAYRQHSWRATVSVYDTGTAAVIVLLDY